MRRFVRISFTILAAMSTMLFVGTWVLWVRSYVASDRLSWPASGFTFTLASAQGNVVIERQWIQPGTALRYERLTYERHAPRSPIFPLYWLGGGLDITTARFEWAGFGWYDVRRTGQTTSNTFAIAPFWGVAILTGALPATWAITRLRERNRQRQRREHGLCHKCGYDLRASPERCPECGESPKHFLRGGRN